MITIIASLVIAAIAIMIVISQRQSVNNMRLLLKNAQEKTIQLEKKIDSSREELRKNKEQLEREKNALQEARDLFKKKLRREPQQELPKSEASMSDKTLEESEKAIHALEAQIEHMKREQSQSEEAIRARLTEEMAKKGGEKEQELEELRKKLSEVQEELKKQKRLMRPEGHKIDLKILPDEAASEFARVYRKAEQHERLHGIARAKLHLAQEKFTELQKRYFTVCRELAVLAGNKNDIEPVAAREIAEKMVLEHQTNAEHKDDHSA